MTIYTTSTGITCIKADEGKAICKATDDWPSPITSVALGNGSTPSDWKDCEYGETNEATEADKDAALETLGVDMTEG